VTENSVHIGVLQRAIKEVIEGWKKNH